VSVLVLDTDVASLSIKGRLSRSMEARLARSGLVAVSFATVGELVQWTEMYDWAPKRKDGVTAFLASVVKLPYSERTAHTWGRISAAAKRRGRSIADNDTWIAASCIARGLPLATRNVKHFEDFAVHHGLDLITD
jgi:toxin FitB